MAELDRAWAALDVVIPENEKARAMRSLIARDVIIGEDRYQFAIELQRLWIQKYEKLEWVKEEIAATLRVWQPPETVVEQQHLQRRARSDLLAVTVILGVFAALIIVLFVSLRSLNESVGIERAQRRTLEAQIARIAEAEATATAAAIAPAATATAGALQLQAEHLTSTAVAVECALPPTALDDFLSRINELRRQAGTAVLVLDDELTPIAARLSADRAAGASMSSDPTVVTVQGCRSDNMWQIISDDQNLRSLVVSPDFVRVGAALTPGALNTLVIKLAAPEPTDTPTASPTPTATSTPRPTRRTLTPTPTVPLPAGPLSLDWAIETQGPNPAKPNQWLVVAVLQASGGDGNYTYYHDGLPVNGPRVQIVDQACRNKPGSFWVQDGTGQIVRKTYYIFAPSCPGSP
jgi:hypothetical protein